MSTKYIAKWPDEHRLINYNATENATWQQLILRQNSILPQYACNEFIAGTKALNLPTDRVPQPSDLNSKLSSTGWKVVSVEGTVNPTDFFTMLKQRHFPVANFIRIPEELDYIQQPDVFHEYFGHAPLLMHAPYADFVQWYGEIALQIPKHLRNILSRLFWYTIEFGLIQTDQGLRIYGGGILSSHQETLFALDSDQPIRKAYDMVEILNTPYDYTQIQPHYFIIDDWDTLYKIREGTDLIEALNNIDPTSQISFNIC